MRALTTASQCCVVKCGFTCLLEDPTVLQRVQFYNGLLSSNSATLKQTLHADLKLVPRAKTPWALDILRAFEGLRGCDTFTQLLSCRGFLFVTRISLLT